MKKQYAGYTTLILVLILISLTQCSKSDPPPETYTLKFSPLALVYVQQPLGKYRIYRDSATSMLDSVVVTESKLQMNAIPASANIFPPIPAYNSQSYDITLTQKNITPNSTWFKAQAGLVLPYPPASTDTASVELWEHNNSLSYFVAHFFHSFPGQLTKTVEGITYTNVLVTINDAGVDISHPAYRRTTYYWAPNIGLIQRTTITTGGAIKTYYLVRNN
jgi:hypothetical protein